MPLDSAPRSRLDAKRPGGEVLDVAARLAPIPSLGIAWVLAETGASTLEDLALGVVVLIGVAQAIRVSRQTGPLDPAAWCPLFFVVAFGGVIPYVRIAGLPPWYESSHVLAYRLGDYISLVVSGFSGLLLGFAFAPQPAARRRPDPPGLNASLEWAALVVVFAGLVGMAWCAASALRNPTTYGHGQFVYEPIYYVRQASQILFFPALALFFSHNGHPEDRWSRLRSGSAFFLTLMFLLSAVALQARAAFLFTAIVIVVPRWISSKEQSGPFKTWALAFGVLLFVTASGLWGYWRLNGSLAHIPWQLVLNPIWVTLSESAAVGGVVATTMELVPAQAPHLWGTSFFAAVPNLLPGFLFPDGRPFLVPSLAFHSLFRPDVVNHGFGFSILAEAYWNFGSWGPLPVLATVAALLRASFRWAHRRGAGMPLAWFAVLTYQTILWFLRADFVVFAKSLSWCLAVFVLVEILATGLKHASKPE